MDVAANHSCAYLSTVFYEHHTMNEQCRISAFAYHLSLAGLLAATLKVASRAAYVH